jgi:anti-sigma-K factor RskA
MDIGAYISSGIIERYVLGSCSLEETTELESLALKYPEIKMEVEEVRSSLDAYALQQAKTPPPQIKSKVMEAIRQENTATKITVSDSPKVISLPGADKIRAVQIGYLKYAAAAALILLLASSTLNYILYGKWKNSEKELAQVSVDKNFVASQFEVQKANYSKAVKDLGILKNTELVRMEMKGAVPAPDAKAMVYCNFKTNEIFLDIKKLPPPADSMQYQFWAIVNGKPIDGGMIELCPSSDTCGIHQMNSIPDAHAFAISLERKGGNPAPKGQIYAVFGI